MNGLAYLAIILACASIGALVGGLFAVLGGILGLGLVAILEGEI